MATTSRRLARTKWSQATQSPSLIRRPNSFSAGALRSGVSLISLRYISMDVGRAGGRKGQAMGLFVFGLAAFVAVGLIGLSPGIRADEKKKQAKPDQAQSDAAKEFAALEKEFQDAQQAFFKAIREAKTDEERQQVLKDKRPNLPDFADRFMKFAETSPDSPEAFQALGLLVGNGRGTEEGNKALAKLKEKLPAIDDLDQLAKILPHVPPLALVDLASKIADKAKKNLDHPQAPAILMWVCSATLYSSDKSELAKLYDSTVDVLMERFADRPELAPLADFLPRDTNPEWAEKHLRKLREKNSDENVKTNAKFGLALVLENKDEASQPEAEKLFQSFIDDSQKIQFADRAKKELEEMKVRGIGKPAPEIAGNDLDDKEFKLADYKGKVVLIDFWGFW